MLVLFQIFLTIALNSSLACSRFPAWTVGQISMERYFHSCIKHYHTISQVGTTELKCPFSDGVYSNYRIVCMCVCVCASSVFS